MTLTSNALDDLTPAVSNPPQWLTTAMQAPRTEGTVEVDGCPIHYFEWGDRSKPGIIMIHGFLAHARCFAFIAPYLANDYHVVSMDMSGMGDSGWREHYAIDNRIAELVAVTQATGLFDHTVKPTIVAHSFGGRIGTATVHAHPDLFNGLIICDLMIIRPSILKANADKFGPPGKRDPNRANRIYPDYETAKSRFVLSPPQKVEHPELFDYMAYHSLKQVEGGWQWKFDPRVFTLPKNPEKSWSEVGEQLILAPGKKAIIYGKKSILFTDDSVDYMNELAEQHNADLIPMIDIPFARHHLMLDQPIAFVTALKSVLGFWR